jgi:TonB family protein
MSRPFAFAALAALAAAPASAEASTWAAAPTAAEMAAAYPEKAKAAGVGGAVDLACSVAPSGVLNDCDVVGELPRGMGFGSAAKELARKLKPMGVARGAELKVPITFAPELATGGPVTVKTPQWTAVPSVTEMQAAVPKTQGGPNDVRVTLVCDVQAGGALSGCAVDREEPEGQGFGPAILALAPKFKTDLMSVEGMPTVGAKVRLPVRFTLKPVEQATK